MAEKPKIKEHDPSEIPIDANFELVGLEAENIKRLKAIRIGLKGKSLVIIGGNNTQGKTSLLDCIPIALGGKKEQPEEVIRRGEKHGKIVLDLDEISPSPDPVGLKVTVVFTAKGGRRLILEGKDGFPFRSPQEIFDRFVSRLTFDPMEFVRMDKEKQVKVIRDLAGIDFAKLDTDYQTLYTERTLLNRDLKAAQGNYETLAKDMPNNIPDNPISIHELLASKDTIIAENRKNDDRKKKVQDLKDQIIIRAESHKAIQHQILDLREEISELTRQRDILSSEISENEEKYADYSERLKSLTWTSTDIIDNQIRDAGRVNEAVSKKKLMLSSKSKVDEIERTVIGLESKMEAIKESKTKMLASAKYPVDGFRIDDDGNLLYNDLPFSQASGMQQIDVAIDMALAINPHLKLALVREGSVIDIPNLKRIAQRVEANGGKLIMERTGKGPEISVIISEGEIEENRL